MAKLVRWDPFRELLDMRDSFDRMLGRFRPDYADMGAWMPAVDIVEKDDSFVLKANLPGIDKENIKITISGDTLTISGKTAEEKKEEKSGTYVYQERVCGSFLRSFTLPALVDRSRVKATYKDGVLQVTLPKAEEAKDREVRVEIS